MLQQKFHIYIRRIVRDPILSVGQQKNWREAIKWLQNVRYDLELKARARLVFSVVAGWGIKNAAVEGLSVEGNREQARPLDGCRGGGIYLFECAKVGIRNCVVRSYNGDGISFQVSEDVAVEDCVCEKNAGLGLHPGIGSQRPVLRRNRSKENDSDGMFVCWRVKHGLFEDNDLRGNKGHGISIGHKDTDNVFRRNMIVGNGKAGVLFRDESEPMGAHRNVFEENTILDNGAADKPDARAAIVVLGHTHDLVFRKNKIGWSKGGAETGVGILVGEHAQQVEAGENEFANVTKEIKR
ncbi:MAG: right-handed parallel beta-helix repeat-containing protein [Planctomycetota bacterium]